MPKNMSGYLVAAIMRMIMMPVLAVCFVHLDAQVSTVGFRGEKIMTAKKYCKYQRLCGKRHLPFLTKIQNNGASDWYGTNTPQQQQQQQQ